MASACIHMNERSSTLSTPTQIPGTRYLVPNTAGRDPTFLRITRTRERDPTKFIPAACIIVERLLSKPKQNTEVDNAGARFAYENKLLTDDGWRPRVRTMKRKVPLALRSLAPSPSFHPSTGRRARREIRFSSCMHAAKGAPPRRRTSCITARTSAIVLLMSEMPASPSRC